MWRRFLSGLLTLPRLFSTARATPEVWRGYVRLTVLRMLVVTLLAAPLMVLRADDLLEDDDEEAPTSALMRTWEWAVSLAGPLFVAQWVVVALTREFDDRVSFSLAHAAGVTPEDPSEPPKPKVRLSWKWMRKRMRRRLQVFFAALPGYVILGFVFSFLPEHAVVGAASSLLGAVWTFYWFVLGTCSKSASAWTTEGSAPPPFFIRAFDRRPVRWVARAWTRMAKALFPPSEMVERKPLELVGLTAMRLINALPMFSLWTRPLVPVAVASILSPPPAPADERRDADVVVSATSDLAPPPGADVPR